jgi:hypothetical protein
MVVDLLKIVKKIDVLLNDSSALVKAESELVNHTFREANQPS